MAPRLVSSTSYTTPANATEILENLKTFLDTNGWTITEWRDACSWDSGWTSGNDAFLQVKTTGYGAQNAIYRFYACDDMAMFGYSNHASDTDDFSTGVILFNMVDPDHETYNGSSATNPVHQNALHSVSTYSHCIRNALVLSEGSMLKMWLFGDDKFCWFSVHLTATLVTHFVFGVPDLINTTFPAGQILSWWSMNMPGDYYMYDFDYPPPDKTAYPARACCMQPLVMKHPVLTDINQIAYDTLAPQLLRGSRNGAIGAAALISTLSPNAWSGIRPMQQDILHYLEDTTYRPYALTPWCYVAYFGGLSIGKELQYGTQTYTVLPIHGTLLTPGSYSSGNYIIGGSYDPDSFNRFGVAFLTSET